MDKRDYFIKAMANKLYLRKDWVISAFSVFMDNDNGEIYPYRLRMVDGKVHYHDPEKDNGLTRLVGVISKEPAFKAREKLIITSGEIPNMKEKSIETTYGRVFYNSLILVWPFGDKFNYINERVRGSKFEKDVIARMKDNPVGETPHDPDEIYVSDYLKFGSAISSLASLTYLFAPAASPKTISVNPAILKRRDELLKEHEDRLHDPAVIAEIEGELINMLREDFKGDESEEFFVKAKTIEVALKKAHVMYGVEQGFSGTGADVKPITKSLAEGWDTDHMPDYINGLRSGIFNRGKNTQLGGESVKFFTSVFQNTRVAEEDCGTKAGLPWTISDSNISMLVGQYMIKDGVSTELTEDQLEKLKGDVIFIRSPMLCKTDPPSYCEKCIGTVYGGSETGLPAAAVRVGSTFMYMFMAAHHGKALKTAKLDITESYT